MITVEAFHVEARQEAGGARSSRPAEREQEMSVGEDFPRALEEAQERLPRKAGADRSRDRPDTTTEEGPHDEERERQPTESAPLDVLAGLQAVLGSLVARGDDMALSNAGMNVRSPQSSGPIVPTMGIGAVVADAVTAITSAVREAPGSLPPSGVSTIVQEAIAAAKALRPGHPSSEAIEPPPPHGDQLGGGRQTSSHGGSAVDATAFAGVPGSQSAVKDLQGGAPHVSLLDVTATLSTGDLSTSAVSLTQDANDSRSEGRSGSAPGQAAIDGLLRDLPGAPTTPLGQGVADARTLPPAAQGVRAEATSAGVLNQVLANLDHLRGSGSGSIVIQLSPPQLGSVRVWLTAEGERVRLRFRVDDVAVREALEAGWSDLRQALHARGVYAEHLVVEVNTTTDSLSNGATSTGQDGASREGTPPRSRSTTFAVDSPGFEQRKEGHYVDCRV